MAGVICAVCGTDNTDDEALCKTCGMLLEEAEKPPATAAPEREPAEPAARCPACGAGVPDPANLVCVECLEPLAAQPAPRAGGAVRLVFGGQAVDVPRPGTVLLGRDPGQSPAAGVFARHDNVSRRHASVGVEPDGRMWVRDEHSTNGTFVNDTPVPGGRTAPLVHGDRLRIASDVVAVVEPGPS
ncbi:FHA domain-containing protein [Amycolatopsis sp. lyj-23]|uniref:FHA domain-containing protein n=1 Tax=Amycolatopsis sp. lyj-23 TaxID=2789283 RepID=UPI003978DF45